LFFEFLNGFLRVAYVFYKDFSWILRVFYGLGGLNEFFFAVAKALFVTASPSGN
jgi:hypothetical protein